MLHNRLPKGVTLVELAVSLAIVSLLMAAVLSVVRNLSRAETAGAARHDADTLAEPLKTAMSADLVHASELSPVPCGFNLKTQAALDGASMEFRHLPAEVEYRLAAIGSRNWLVRVQGPQQPHPQVELVCTGVSGFCIDPLNATDTSPAGMGAASAFAVTVEFEGKPGRSIYFVVRKD